MKMRLLFLVAANTFFYSLSKIIADIPRHCLISSTQYKSGKSLVCPFNDHCPDRYHSTPTVSRLICNGKFDIAQPSSLRQHMTDTSNETNHIIRRYVVFKTARTGSHMITSILNDVVAASNRPSISHFEPFCRDPCYGQATPKEERKMLGLLFRNLLCKEIVFQGDNWKCLSSYECPYCNVTACDATSNHYGALAPLVGIALNPRFTDRLDWANVLYGSQKPYNEAAINSTRIFNLRRTNLVRQAYSKRHHGGCSLKRISFGWDNETYVVDNKLWRSGRINLHTFNSTVAMMCLEGYALWEQEYSSSVAVAAAQREDSLLLLLYEDMMADMDLAQQQIASHLRVRLSGTVAERTVKRHSSNMCVKKDVDCKELDSKWGNGQYPCLMKQLHDTDEGKGWTVPMLPNGSIHIRGDCHPLRPLDAIKHPRRQYEDLYSLNSQS